ncbi:inositol-1,4,5-trisphosphate 5-phosphatase-like protein [Elsinoe australis]|uniref:phosphoinositide 5-phosphatase n=1 Tax=Elsinoe australis TaxID=40998 RepID=A0A4U7B1Z8_9PEZI|nr:inositol-1,4,5-trisphosphate 5-phosphatase-like protein [Elsinoe australis]
MTIRVLLRDYPHRAVALATDDHVLTFRHNKTDAPDSRIPSSTTANGQNAAQPQCMVDFSPTADSDLSGFRSLTSLSIHGTLGLVTISGDIFLCVVNGANRVATLRPGENVQQITSVEFHCINRSDHDFNLGDVNRYGTDYVDEDGYDTRHGQAPLEHPCLALKKLLSGGSFYYSADFDLTRRLQDRPADSPSIALDSLDRGFLWNAFMIQPLISFRSRLSEQERTALDQSKILTSAIRGFAMTLTVPAASAPISTNFSGMPSTITLISCLSCRRAGTRFNARGIDDDGNVANFVETETTFWAPTGMSFSYVQIRGSVPVFWEQTAGFTPGQQKIQLTRSAEATQPAFDKHFAEMESWYGATHIVNLLGNDKVGELDLSNRYRYHVSNSSLNHRAGEKADSSSHDLIRQTDYDFHAETRGQGYDAAQSIKHWLQDSADAFVYFLAEEVEEEPKAGGRREKVSIRRPVTILQQEGTFRTNCLDCLDRTNVVQTIISQMALEEFIRHRGERRSSADFWLRHSTLWADNGDALSKIYAGTGALKSSFTRSGKMSLAGALADVRKSATRLYINNFEDKGRQNTIDMLLGRLMGQAPVHLFDPINDWVSAELVRRTAEYTKDKSIRILAGTFNLNGKQQGMAEDLSPWLCPHAHSKEDQPEIIAVGFQEIVELSPQQIMSTDPNRRLAWEEAVKDTLNRVSQQLGDEEYVLLRGGQLVGASLSVFVKAGILSYIKNVEGSLKKTGMSGIAGNKGAVAIRMDYANTSICLVTAHLAAGFANYEERNQDYRTISHGLRFQRNRTIEDHDSIIWLGDFNYRIGMSNERTRQMVKIGDLEGLYENDQLHLQMMHGKTFPHYSEARITFLPTYKYDLGTDYYDSSEKARIPAWCDRILSKGDNLRQLDYDTAPLRFSDHRPVYANFQCIISMVDAATKQRISDVLYHKRRGAVMNGTTAPTDLTSDDEDLLDYEAIEPGLPPPSSDKRKWWLDGGMPARSTVKPPADAMVPNPKRPSNPYTASAEPDWVKVERPSPSPKPAAPPPRRIPARSDSTRSVEAPRRRNLPPPYQGQLDAAQVQNGAKAAPADDDEAPPPLPSRASTFSETTTTTKSTLKKPPFVPKKPLVLRSDSMSSTTSTPAASVASRSLRGGTASPTPSATGSIASQPPSGPGTASKAQPSPPPPRRSLITKPAPGTTKQPDTKSATASPAETKIRSISGSTRQEEPQRFSASPPDVKTKPLFPEKPSGLSKEVSSQQSRTEAREQNLRNVGSFKRVPPPGQGTEGKKIAPRIPGRVGSGAESGRREESVGAEQGRNGTGTEGMSRGERMGGVQVLATAQGGQARGGKNLMDEEDAGLKGWEPLRPS